MVDKAVHKDREHREFVSSCTSSIVSPLAGGFVSKKWQL